jgi:oligoendopeptidase F
MKASIQPKLGSWSLNSLVRDPNGTQFKEFLERLLEDSSESIASRYAHVRYAADSSSNDAASPVTRIDMLEAEVSNRLLFFDLRFKKKINPNDIRDGLVYYKSRISL